MNNYNYLFKFIIVGDTNVGKSCLLLQFTETRFRQEHDATIGVEFGSRNLLLQDRSLKLQIWDTAGQESFRSITRSYYRGSIGALLVFDITNRTSYDSIIRWCEEIKGHACDKIELFIIGNKNDLEEREVQYNEAKQFFQKNGYDYYETSAKTSDNVENVFIKLAEKVLNKVESGDIDPTNELYGIKIGALSQNRIVKQDNQGQGSVKINLQEQQKQSCC